MLLTAGLAVALVLAPGESSRAVDAWLLAVGAVGIALATAAVARALGEAPPSAFERALARPRRAAAGLPELAELERAVLAAAASELEAHRRLRPLLRQIASERLAASGRDLDRDGEAVLDPGLWDLVRPHRTIHDREGRGPSPAELRRLVEILERMPR